MYMQCMTEDGTFISFSLSFAVVPEVEVTSDAPNSRVTIGETITLNCGVTRGIPTSYTYEWTQVDNSDKFTETSSTLTISVTSTSQLGTYVCAVNNGAGTGTGDITIAEGSKLLCARYTHIVHVMY